MSSTYIILITVYIAVAIFLTYVPDEDLESLTEIIVFLITLVVLTVSVDEIWG